MDMLLDKHTSYAGYFQLDDPEEQDMIDEMHEQYMHEYKEQLSHPATPRFREYLKMCVETLEWRLSVDIPEKRKLAKKIIIPSKVEYVEEATDADYLRAMDVCRSAISVINKFLQKETEYLLVQEALKENEPPVPTEGRSNNGV